MDLDEWLTGHRSIILFDLQLDAQNSYLFTYNTFIKILYMFRALPCSSSGGLRRNCIYLHIIHLLKSSTCFEHYPAHLQEVYVVIVYMQPLVSSLSAGDCLVHRLFLNRCTGQSPAESDDTRGCRYTITT